MDTAESHQSLEMAIVVVTACVRGIAVRAGSHPAGGPENKSGPAIVDGAEG